MNNLANNLLYVIILIPGVVFAFAVVARLALLVVNTKDSYGSTVPVDMGQDKRE